MLQDNAAVEVANPGLANAMFRGDAGSAWAEEYASTSLSGGKGPVLGVQTEGVISFISPRPIHLTAAPFLLYLSPSALILPAYISHPIFAEGWAHDFHSGAGGYGGASASAEAGEWAAAFARQAQARLWAFWLDLDFPPCRQHA